MPLTTSGDRPVISAKLARQLLKFGVGGGLTFATDYLTFTVLFAIGTPLFIASSCSFLAGFAVSFTVNKLWVFGATNAAQHHKTALQVALYVALLIFNLLFTYYFILLTSQAGLSAYVGKLVTIILVTSWNFVLYKKIIFKVKQ